MSRREPRPLLYLLGGLLVGGLYVVLDIVSESRLEQGTLNGVLAAVHEVVDRVSPLLVGALVGLGVFQLRLQARLRVAEEGASRAEALRQRLHKVERDQAVWVLAAAVLHELNNPLHALGLLLDEQAACADEPARRDGLVERARAQATRALGHLQTLRSLGAGGEPELGDVALDAVVRSLAADASSLAEAEGVRVEARCDAPAVAHADPAYVRTILENLLDNALQSLRGKTGGSVVILLGSEAGRAVIRVHDDGAPLHDGVATTLFDPLRTTKTHGLGLGLPIARALARAMRGDVVLESPLTKTFRVELPLAEVR